MLRASGAPLAALVLLACTAGAQDVTGGPDGGAADLGAGITAPDAGALGGSSLDAGLPPDAGASLGDGGVSVGDGGAGLVDGGAAGGGGQGGIAAPVGGAQIPTCAPWPACTASSIPTCAPWPSCAGGGGAGPPSAGDGGSDGGSASGVVSADGG